MAEYELLMKAERLHQVDIDYRCHMIAYLTKVASAEKATGSKGKTTPVYKTFKKFYDYDSEIEKVLKGKNEDNERFAAIREYRRKKEG